MYKGLRPIEFSEPWSVLLSMQNLLYGVEDAIELSAKAIGYHKEYNISKGKRD